MKPSSEIQQGFIKVYEPYLAAKQKEYVNEALAKNELSYRGSFHPAFREKLARSLKTDPRKVALVSNGSVALFAAYRHFFPVGCRVAVPSVTYAATISQLHLVGCKPWYYGWNKDTYQGDGESLMSIISEVDGVVVSALYSDIMENIDCVEEECARRNIPLVVDAAQAFACSHNGRPLGSFGNAATYSFFANKVITTGGEGGAITCRSEKDAQAIEAFCNQNTNGGYEHFAIGTNFRMTNIQAAIGLAQLEEIGEIVRRKQQIAGRYRTLLRNVEAIVPSVDESAEWMPVFRHAKAVYPSIYRRMISDYGIETRPAFPPVHRMNGFGGRLAPGMEETCVEDNLKRSFILPCHPGLSNETLEFIIKSLNEAVF